MRRPPVEKHKDAASIHTVPKILVFLGEFISFIALLTIPQGSQLETAFVPAFIIMTEPTTIAIPAISQTESGW